MSGVIVNNGRYTVEPLYQWDTNQVLEIRGLSLSSIPEVHFAHEEMERTIVRQATMDDAGIITVLVPNSLLQKAYTIKAYICIQQGDSFNTLYTISIPVKPRKKPSDYTIQIDEDIYSFNKLENLINNAINNINADYDETKALYDDINVRYNEALYIQTESNATLETVTRQTEESKTNYDNAVIAYNAAATAYADASKILGDSADILETLKTKANKSTVVEATLSVSGWSGNTYSFENTYPVATYDIEIALNGTATEAQAEAFNSAQIVGSATSNIVTAFGDIPTVDIPIIVKAVAK